jgi:hypothetical protein
MLFLAEGLHGFEQSSAPGGIKSSCDAREPE